MREILSGDSERCVRVLAQENGKTELEALSQEIIPLLDTLEYLEKNAADVLSDRPVKLGTRQFYFRGKRNAYIHVPYGVIGILGTWNYPLFLCMTQVLFALTAGNAVVLKGSEFSERVTDLIEELLKASGFPEDLFYCFSAGSGAGEAVCRAGCDKYVLTGSRRTGKAVMRLLSDNLKPAVIELSGCDPYVILSDADWDLAARTLLWAAYQYSGQTCVAPRRVLILKRDKEFFLSAFGRAWGRCGDYLSRQGMLRSAMSAAQEKAKLEELIGRGAAHEFGSPPTDKESAYCPPQVLSGLGPGDVRGLDLMSPVVVLIECEDERRLLEAAGASDFALGASLWTRDRRKAGQWARQIRAGQLWVNDSIFSVALGEVSFGGFKDSGFGKTRGPEGLLEMVEKKFVSFGWRSRRSLRHLPPYPAYSYAALDEIQRMIYLPSWKGKARAFFRLCALFGPGKK